MKNKLLLISILALINLAITSSNVMARSYSTQHLSSEHSYSEHASSKQARHSKHHFNSKNRFKDKAKVIKVTPLYKTVRTMTPHKECWQEEISVDHYHNKHHLSDDNSGIILGGLIGGAAGHQFGKGHGKEVATVIGSVIGAVVGNNIEKNNHHRNRHYHSSHDNQEPYYKTQCKTHKTYSQTKKIVGYKVKYRYQGHNFWTKTKHHPGKYLDIRINLHPLG